MKRNNELFSQLLRKTKQYADFAVQLARLRNLPTSHLTNSSINRLDLPQLREKAEDQAYIDIYYLPDAGQASRVKMLAEEAAAKGRADEAKWLRKQLKRRSLFIARAEAAKQ